MGDNAHNTLSSSRINETFRTLRSPLDVSDFYFGEAPLLAETPEQDLALEKMIDQLVSSPGESCTNLSQLTTSTTDSPTIQLVSSNLSPNNQVVQNSASLHSKENPGRLSMELGKIGRTSTAISLGVPLMSLDLRTTDRQLLIPSTSHISYGSGQASNHGIVLTDNFQVCNPSRDSDIPTVCGTQAAAPTHLSCCFPAANGTLPTSATSSMTCNGMENVSFKPQAERTMNEKTLTQPWSGKQNTLASPYLPNYVLNPSSTPYSPDAIRTGSSNQVGVSGQEDQLTPVICVQLKKLPKLRYSKGAAPSKYCHVCGRGAKTVNVAVCGNNQRGLCRKIICEKCLVTYNQATWETISAGNGSWTCTHCRGDCPRASRCFQYQRNNRNRKKRDPRSRGSSSGSGITKP